MLLSAFVCAQQPVANFSSDITGGCAPIVVNFRDLSTGNPTTWEWDLGNGATSSKQNPSATYFNTGTYTVSLRVTNANGTHTVTKTAYITVFVEPRVDFIATKLTGCTPAVIPFQDRSTTPPGTKIVGWKWDFGDGSSATDQNPTHIYRAPGSYTVTLTITNDKGCTRLITKPNYVDIIQGVVPSISFTDPGVCSAPATVNFQNNSTGPGFLTYSWNLGNGTSSAAKDATATYNSNGNYRVSLIVSSSLGCTDSTAVTVPVGKATTDFIVPASICPKVPVQFLNNSTPRPVSALWKFSNGTTDTLKNGMNSFPAPGTYTVTLINTYTVCTDSLTKTVTVAPVPTLSFRASDTSKCQPPLTVNFSNSSTGTTYKWDFGDGGATSTSPNPSFTYTKYGEFDVTLIATGPNGCSDTLRKPKYIRILKPVIRFPNLPTQGCIPYDFDFKADITSLDSVTSYKWDFGDGGTSTERFPKYTYKDSGTYDVTLTITTTGGCTEKYTLPKAVRVGPRPKADFTSDLTVACADPGIKFINLSTGATEYKWTFSDGTSSTEKDPQHKFNDIGLITVTLSAINNGCEDKITKKDYATIRPSVSRFDYQPNCSNRLEYSFTDKSIQANTWEWDFGDGSPKVNAQNPGAHTFPGPGSWNVSLTTTNGACKFTLVRTIKIIDNTPDFTATTSATCKPAQFSFRSSSPDSLSIKTWEWDFGDGSTGTTTSNLTSHIYTKPGVNTVTLTTVDSFGCRNTRTKPIDRVNGPKAGFTSTSNSGCKGMTTTFTDTTVTDGVNNIVSWTWDFGDSTRQTYTAPPFQHTYDSIGDYDVKLIVTDAAGCMDSVVLREFVKVSTLKAKWEIHTQSCPNSPAWFGNLTTSDFAYTTLWDFGNGDTSTDRQLWYTYKDTGVYTVRMIVTDEYGCQDSVVQKDAVKIAVPKASFDANNLTSYCTPFPLQLTNTSYFYQSSYWELSQGTSTQTNPTAYYTSTGTYPIKLVVTSAGGCKDSASAVLKVYSPQDATLTYSPLFGCRPLAVNFEAFTEMNARFIWDFADGNVIDTTINKITHIYDDPGAFQPRIILKQPECPDLAKLGDQWVEIVGAKPKFNLPQRLFCDSGYITIIDSTVTRDRITSYTWDFGDGTVSNNPVPPPHFYSQPGLYDISLAVATESGCKDTFALKPGVKVVQSPLVSIGGDSVICVNERISHFGVFERQDTSAVRWAWQLPNGNNSSLQNPAPQQYPVGSHLVRTVVTNSSGCKDTATKRILVNPIPVITAPSPLTKIVGVPLTLPATYSSGVVSYLWSPAATLDCSTCPQPSATPKFTTTYTVAVTDSNGCANTAEIKVIVVCQGATVFLPNTFSPNGDGANDVFYVRGIGLDRVKSLRVFNRWGEVVFEQRDFPSNNPAYGWNGTYKGRKASADVYVYQVEIYCENGEIIRFEGNVALIL